jgi:hypothetical protein
VIKKYLNGIIFLLIALVTIVILLFFNNKTTPVESQIFCAYNRLFIEFDDGKYKWGTMLFDDDGHPMDCKRYIDREDIGKLRGMYGT